MDYIYFIVASVIGFIFTLMWRVCFSRALSNGWKQESSNFNIKCPRYLLISLTSSLWVTYGMHQIIVYTTPSSIYELLNIVFSLWLLIVVGLSAKYYVAAKVNSRITFFHYFGNLIHLILVGLILLP